MINNIDFLRYLIDLTDTNNADNSVPTPSIVVNIGSDSIKQPNGRENTNLDSSIEEDDDEEIIVSMERELDKETEEELDGENPMDRDDVFIPPLQAKLEIMKKLAGIQPKHQELITSVDDEPFED